MHKLIVICFTMLAIFGCATTGGYGRTLAIDPSAVRVLGPIRYGDFFTPNAIETALAKPEAKHVDLVINSPGGSVSAGMQIIQSIRRAQSRGLVVRCAVTRGAASMALIILSACSERYAFRYSELQFHNVVVMPRQPVNIPELVRYLDMLTLDETAILPWFRASFGWDEKTFEHHYRNGTSFYAEELLRRSPGYLTIIDDLQGVDGTVW